MKYLVTITAVDHPDEFSIRIDVRKPVLIHIDHESVRSLYDSGYEHESQATHIADGSTELTDVLMETRLRWWADKIAAARSDRD